MQICSKLEIILTFSRKCLFYRIFTLPIFTLPPFEEPRTLTFVLWIGISISKFIDEKKVGIEAGVVVEKEKIYTVIRDGYFKPHLNLEEKLATLVSRRG